ncbi:alpha/beta fold hydrolase [Georgenia sp. AZ-5]|uniref:alpha/beta fold hydrolase n=1 Tax=Georgenia sp. AZ-5 TaxID=3367526 RepID=UPI0037540DE2
MTTSRAARPPHEEAPAVHVRRGGFWLPGDLRRGTGAASPRDAHAGQTWQLGPAWVQWEAPAEPTGLPPLVFVHGGGGQSTDWLGTAGAEEGWAQLALAAGHPAYLLDRPGHGRSPWDPARLGARTPSPDYAGLAAVFVPAEDDPRAAGHGAWPWGRGPGDSHVDAQVASSSGMLLDTALGQELDGRRLVDLLERTGPAVVVTHSAGAPAGWLAADRRPDLVFGLVAVEPLGPPFRDLGPRGRLTEGPTAVPLTWDRSGATARLPRLARTPVCVVSGSASGRVDGDRQTVAFLRDAGVAVDHLELAAHGLAGNGHGLIFENNNRVIFDLLTHWVNEKAGMCVA